MVIIKNIIIKMTPPPKIFQRIDKNSYSYLRNLGLLPF
nr:MAG TPA: hypothetical protein [Caudoviricetes sp.]